MCVCVCVYARVLVCVLCVQTHACVHSFMDLCAYMRACVCMVRAHICIHLSARVSEHWSTTLWVLPAGPVLFVCVKTSGGGEVQRRCTQFHLGAAAGRGRVAFLMRTPSGWPWVMDRGQRTLLLSGQAETEQLTVGPPRQCGLVLSWTEGKGPIC